MRIVLFALCVVAIISPLTGCKKSDNGDDLPPATRAGNYILAFRIDGTTYVAQGKNPGGFNFLYVHYAEADLYASDTVGSISAVDETHNAFSLAVYVHRPSSSQPFTLDPTRGTTELSLQNDLFNPDSTGPAGSVNFDYVNDSVLAGTFDLTLHSIISGKTVHLTDGRFDVGR